MEPGIPSLRTNFLSPCPFPQAGHPWRETESLFCQRVPLSLGQDPTAHLGARGRWGAVGWVMLYRHLCRSGHLMQGGQGRLQWGLQMKWVPSQSFPACIACSHTVTCAPARPLP